MADASKNTELNLTDPSLETLGREINSLVSKAKLYYFQRIFRRMQQDKDDALTPLETFCIEVIAQMDEPTVSDFAEYINVSQPNAAYKVMNLEKKDYLTREKSPTDGRVTLLKVTPKYYEVFGTSQRYARILARRLKQNFSDRELKLLGEMVKIISTTLLDDMNRYLGEINLSPEVLERARARGDKLN